MAVKWFKHGKWPSWLVGLHHYTIGSFFLLLLTGIALYAPAVHAVLIPYLPWIYRIHILLGLIFGATLLAPVVGRLPTGKRLWRLDWWFPLTFGVGIVITGILLWRVAWFPTVWRSASFTWHGDLSYILALWIVLHAFARTFGLRPRDSGWTRRFDPERRQFVRWLSWGGVGAAVLVVLDPFPALTRVFQARSSSTAPAAQFAAYYTVTGSFPAMKLADYRLQVDGHVLSPRTFTWSELMALPPAAEIVDFHCVTGWSVPSVTWGGIHLTTVGAHVHPTSSARYVHFYSFDGAYTESLSLAEALDPSVLLAYHLNGAALPAPQGYPVRLVVPKMFGYKSIKWVSRIEYSDQPLNGFWEQRGYPDEAYIGS